LVFRRFGFKEPQGKRYPHRLAFAGPEFAGVSWAKESSAAFDNGGNKVNSWRYRAD
jgi:hypothetical protein